MLCSRCKKRMAVIFVSREVDGKPVSEGLCFQCAKELNIPQINNIADKIDIESIENVSNQIMGMFGVEDFEPGGADVLNPFTAAFGAKNNDQQADSTNNQRQNANSKSQNDKSKSNKQKFKYLTNFGLNLTQRAKDNKLDHVIGRDKEIYRVVQILSRRTKNNPCLIGEPGVGKTAIAEGIAQKIANGNVPYRLSNKELYLLDMTALVAGTQFRGQFESRVKGLISEVKQAGNIILFIDEIHTLIGTGDSEGSMSAANILKPALSRGEIQLIGATTFGEYRKYIESDSALERRFQPVTINEPNINDSIKILKGIKAYYEKYHKVKVSSQIIFDAVMLSERYINDRYLPDKAIDLLDEACACRSLRSKEITEYDKILDEYNNLIKKDEALKSETEDPDYQAIAEVKSELSRIKQEKDKMEPLVKDIYVEQQDLTKVIELWTGIPASKVEHSETLKLRNLELELKSKIIGQDKAIEALSKAIRRRRVQLAKRRRPASFIFVGPTGVGKTELVKVLADVLFDGIEPLIRIDMSEYMEKHTVSRLTGSPPGYVGYDDAGQLTEKVRRRPYSVILFDEIEKAHPDVMNLLLQILDEGKVTDSHGRSVNFENTVIIMTSNAGSTDKSGIVGFDKTQDQLESDKAKKALEKFLRPEFIARVDEIIVFNKLTNENLQSIAALMLDELKEVLSERGIEFNYDKKATTCLIKPIENSKYGARDLRKEIRKKVEDFIAGVIINSQQPLEKISISAKENNIIFSLNDSYMMSNPLELFANKNA
ncbi:MAG: ATP-dependent Clp protease ATP-binding subunit [Oscillospiraceae bacterium]|nr:ATP-dependent Clp protease ATP-binding subunit [Oscillospiraceae bacterium]